MIPISPAGPCSLPLGVDVEGDPVGPEGKARERLEADEGWLDIGFVVCRPDGRPLWPQGAEQLKSLFKKAGLPEFSSHVMRHTAVTLMLAEGVHPKIVQERLGHSSIKVTLDLYRHLIRGMLREAADRLEDMLFQ